METSLLDTANWIQLKAFLNLDRDASWREKLNCYYGILSLLRPVLTNRQLIDTFFFTQYGPKDYASEPETMYIRRIESIPETQISYIRIRIHPLDGRREDVVQAVATALLGQPLILVFEIFDGFENAD